MCPNCGNNYNIADINTPDGYVMKPLLPEEADSMMDGLECGDCKGVKLIQRDDDKEHTIRGRLLVYE